MLHCLIFSFSFSLRNPLRKINSQPDHLTKHIRKGSSYVKIDNESMYACYAFSYLRHFDVFTRLVVKAGKSIEIHGVKSKKDFPCRQIHRSQSSFAINAKKNVTLTKRTKRKGEKKNWSFRVSLVARIAVRTVVNSGLFPDSVRSFIFFLIDP